MKKRVFVSYDFDNDKTLKDFIVGQSRLPDSPFEVIDHSLICAARSMRAARVLVLAFVTMAVIARPAQRFCEISFGPACPR